ncbi:chromosomal replication initiator protein DnaA [Candidatus Roizmanbacteria bacterium CG22_combo_CG10-13_8_21_14_all_38_20]|uniref:Chromosomal replication initiator protein DnaA n=1 Tax=Candidatus Roizmanbacteria bacterium CG22_combo_CG10-13_8_21_14_all_38_20 TaxID=1974862 RepID=A0A2H0BTT4_9BACT|nr:MAG: chromosomal replication initiator protein DnaA [Candidatus Roizmanbacteria bacterium CG22_combo_CG10-13_8_21_14_all_38_20]PJC32409.1 MAG: chromosomal replication initiator protein DnaA [Candidatus Roizmanbacteria bacterium CG_4_9_14_0_2_um_filter_38_17]
MKHMNMDLKQLWEEVLAEVELEVSKPEFSAFFSSAQLEKISDGFAIISCRNNAERQFLEQKFNPIITKLLSDKLKLPITIQVNIRQEANGKEVDLGPLFTPTINTAGLDPLYTIDNFAVSSSNQLAYAAAMAIIKNPGKTYNPLFLWGGVGFGKTHLMHSIGHEILKQDSSVKIVSCMGEEFTNGIVEAIKNNTTDAFKRKYRQAQLLLLDDIQFIQDKIKVQEEFFHTFVSIKKAGGQIVLTSDRAPHELFELEARLRSRFEAGLIIDISPPNFELRSAIVLIKARQRGKSIPMDVAQYLAEQIDDTRRLEGALIRLLTESEIDHKPLTIEFAEGVLGKTSNNNSTRPRATVSDAMKLVSNQFNITLSDLKGERRTRSIAAPRQILMYLLRKELKMSFQDIGLFLGGRDHTTIIHGVDKVVHKLLKDPGWSGEILQIKKLLSGKNV